MILALLSYYDEKDSWLKDIVRSLHHIGAEKLVALDGAYALYPGGKASSPVSNHRALAKACDRAGVDLTHVAPTCPWQGNEVEKRTRLFQLAETVSTTDDWFVVIDADSPIVSAEGFQETISNTTSVVGTLTVQERKPDGQVDDIKPRAVFKAQRDIRVVGQHFDYKCGDQTLWGNYGVNEVEGFDSGIVMEHRTLERRPDRRAASLAYYDTRDELGIEFGACAWCETVTPSTIPFQWHKAGWIRAKRANVCDACRPQRERESLAQLAEHGISLSSLSQLPKSFLT